MMEEYIRCLEKLNTIHSNSSPFYSEHVQLYNVAYFRQSIKYYYEFSTLHFNYSQPGWRVVCPIHQLT